MLQVIARVPAKINLVLTVGPVRRDGFHELATVFHAVSLCDQVTAVPGDGVRVTVTGPYGADTPTDESNLAVQAVRALARRAGVPANVRLDIHKAIPVAAGLAGGSADAAGALLACDRLWGLGLAASSLASIAATLGSDVPFALTGGTAIGTGRGERLRPVDVDGTLHWVLAVAGAGLATPSVYGRLDVQRAGDAVPAPRVGQEVLSALQTADPAAVGAALRNDLQDAAIELQPALTATLRAGRDLGALGGLVSGSGPTCVFLARDGAHAAALAGGLAASGTCADVVAVTGPVLTGA